MSVQIMEKPQANLLSKQALNQLIDERLDELLPTKLAEIQANKTPCMAIIATKGTLDWAYPPFILASTGAALGWDVSIFFTFYGLELLKKELALQVSPLGNPAMPMKMPMGPNWLRQISWNVPNALQSMVPGYESVATHLMKKTIKNVGVAEIQDLRQMSMEAGVKLVACQMTVDLFGYQPSDFLPEVTDYIGAASFLPVAQAADVSLFI